MTDTPLCPVCARPLRRRSSPSETAGAEDIEPGACLACDACRWVGVTSLDGALVAVPRAWYEGCAEPLVPRVVLHVHFAELLQLARLQDDPVQREFPFGRAPLRMRRIPPELGRDSDTLLLRVADRAAAELSEPGSWQRLCTAAALLSQLRLPPTPPDDRALASAPQARDACVVCRRRVLWPRAATWVYLCSACGALSCGECAMESELSRGKPAALHDPSADERGIEPCCARARAPSSWSYPRRYLGRRPRSGAP